ncbi:unnamed protein product [Musa acuminata subsp. malaccensis]|uniref:(wild Malaysian banana) hypothetical protein n=1 Tax=Musa acuminata subsp. malaccensis TaxID=214687 RepID=A0A804L3W8_MUSAM|nr:PREDICTED: uncharacterized protein LOC103970343 [Musa acuminata subsp. malaccensis]CAG1863465.1 unnamed protein product [Musa acuminata subsp. malaccensis]
MEGDGAAAEKAPAADAVATSQEEPTPSSSSSTKSPFDPCISAAAPAPAATSPGEILRALQVVERDSVAIAESYASLFSSLRIALSEVTSTSLENMQCFNDVVGRLQESALDAATKGNRYINSCLRLNEEMKSLESLALQLKILRKNVDNLDVAVNRVLRLP